MMLGYLLHTHYSRYDQVILENKIGENMITGNVEYISRMLSKYLLQCDVIDHSKDVIRINYIWLIKYPYSVLFLS